MKLGRSWTQAPLSWKTLSVKFQAGLPERVQKGNEPAPIPVDDGESDGSIAYSIADTNLGVRLAACILSLLTFFPQPSAQAVLSSPKARVPRTAESALRRSIPAFNKAVSELQELLEDVQYRLRIPQRKPWKDMQNNVTRAQEIAGTKFVYDGVLEQDMTVARQLISGIQEDLRKLDAAVTLKDADRTSIRVSNALERIGDLELLQTPGLPYPIAKQYLSMPRLTGRAVVEFSILKRDNNPIFDSEKGNAAEARFLVTLDGFSAPLTAGRFVANVQKNLYDNLTLHVNETSVLGIPDAKGDSGLEPLEILAQGDFEPTYRLELDPQLGELPVLPLSINGSIAMAKATKATATNGFVSDTNFFMFKFDRQRSGLSGLAFEEGQFGVFGYITAGANNLNKIEEGDKIVSAKLVKGANKLVMPEMNSK
eukprot:jgi/Picsp_1/4997/NSC_02360-R1_peptidyl-prolycis-trans isomerase protein